MLELKNKKKEFFFFFLLELHATSVPHTNPGDTVRGHFPVRVIRAPRMQLCLPLSRLQPLTLHPWIIFQQRAAFSATFPLELTPSASHAASTTSIMLVPVTLS